MKYDVEIQLRVKHRQVDFGGFLPGNWEEIDPNRKHPAVILLAGGAYWRRSSREKEPVALKLLGYGISPWILEYSVAPETFPQSLCEVLTAVKWLREHSEEYGIDGENISSAGFPPAATWRPVPGASGSGISFRKCWGIRGIWCGRTRWPCATR